MLIHPNNIKIAIHSNNITIHHQLINIHHQLINNQQEFINNQQEILNNQQECINNQQDLILKIMIIHMIDPIRLIRGMLSHLFMRIKTRLPHLFYLPIEPIIISKEICNINDRKIY